MIEIKIRGTELRVHVQKLCCVFVSCWCVIKKEYIEKLND